MAPCSSLSAMKFGTWTSGLAEEVARFLAEMSGLGGLALVYGDAASGGARA